MRFLLDAQMPHGLTAHFEVAGHESIHMRARLPASAKDAAVASLANELQAVLISKDIDFVDLAARGVLRMPLVWLRTGNMSRRQTIAVLLPALPRLVAAIEAGEQIVELR